MKRENPQNKYVIYVMDNVLSLSEIKLLELITMIASGSRTRYYYAYASIHIFF